MATSKLASFMQPQARARLSFKSFVCYNEERSDQLQEFVKEPAGGRAKGKSA
jgi:hypothetical protein